MTFPRRMAAITGVYSTVQGKKLGRTEESLKLEAIKGALADSGLSFDRRRLHHQAGQVAAAAHPGLAAA
ncbi:MAG: hypothetical protein ACRDPY_43695 [Streptosporangiaceae bacterium]